MITRRFGRTGLAMPILTCGGMRFQQSWTAGDAVGDESQRNLEATVRRALELGICHLETARGYGTSEEQLGRLLPELPRDQLLVQTKVAPSEDPREFVASVEDSLRRLRLDHVDLLGLHGLNDDRVMDLALRDGGCLEAALRLRERGLTRCVGFSTHAPLPVILRGIADPRFEYVNLHYYYVFQDNGAALAAAAARDLGVLVISPNDKGGRLYEPPPKLVELTRPLSPMVFNDLFCWQRPELHTLSIGVARPTDFDEHLRAAEHLAEPATPALIAAITARLDAEYERVLGTEWARGWRTGLPSWEQVPGGINVSEIVRLHNLAQAFELVAYGRMRYGLLGNGGHWFPGAKAAALDRDAVRSALVGSPFAERVLEVLAAAQALFGDADAQRLQREG